jgi:hypothetical protein
MSADIKVIEQYLDQMSRAALSIPEDWETIADRKLRILGNYQASLNETATYHKWFIQLRDGEGCWADQMDKLRAEKVAAETMLRHYIDRYGTAVIDDNS